MALPDIVMVFIGESGSGKSTCINYFANCFTQSNFTETDKYAKMKIVIPNGMFPNINLSVADRAHSEQNVGNNTTSQTQECIVYSFVWENRSIRVVDTPGFNDTDMNRDEVNIKKILTKMSELPFVSAILITINGSAARLSTGLRTALNQMRSSLPDSVFNNLFFIFTNCTEETKNFPDTLLSAFNPSRERMFIMQNSLYSLQDQSVLTKPNIVRRMVCTWGESVEIMTQIMNTIRRMAPASIAVFEKMRVKREGLISDREMLILKQKSLINVMKTLNIEKERLNTAKQDKSNNQNFIQIKTIDVIDIEKKSYYSTMCAQHGDVSICHENCSLTYTPQLNFDHFKRCAAADGNNCRHCKCGMNKHFHSYEIPVNKTRDIEGIIQGKHSAFLRASCEINNIEQVIQHYESTIQQYQIEINVIRNQLLQSMRELKTICTHFNFVEEMSNTVEKLRKEGQIANNLAAKQEFDATANAIEQLIVQLR